MIVGGQDFTRQKSRFDRLYHSSHNLHRCCESRSYRWISLPAEETDVAAREATPPMWKVRIVNCVPGSPMDCAAIAAHLRLQTQVTTVAHSRINRTGFRRGVRRLPAHDLRRQSFFICFWVECRLQQHDQDQVTQCRGNFRHLNKAFIEPLDAPQIVFDHHEVLRNVDQTTMSSKPSSLSSMPSSARPLRAPWWK